MQDEKKLYPMRFVPSGSAGTIFHVADLGYIESEVQNGYLSADTLGDIMDTYMDRVVGDDVFAWYGRQFPVMVSTLKGGVPLSVCPDDVTASQRWDLLGKCKLWYVASAGEDASVSIGFSRTVSAAELYEACLGGGVAPLLHTFTPEVGRAYLIPPGTVHSCSGRITVVEVAQSSPLDFRLLDADEENGLTLQEALDFIDLGAFREPSPLQGDALCVPLARTEQFNVNELRLCEALRISSGGAFSLYSCICGRAAVHGGDEDTLLCEGEAVLLPAELDDFTLAPMQERTVLLEITVPARSVADAASPDAFGDDAIDSPDDIEYAD